ncbi:hypothetical protein N657DRAFT_657516 [Parathielavia appendiculata]|uniref:Thioesterase domain-containing protein n=1 Tax=Parathielavia appendiculata TaxID=2587402 RepID=A0AAN6TWG0_9PEZI|nr:hypothetical protein N657DRAFT_657516 [Parathielavia appendiculata]
MSTKQQLEHTSEPDLQRANQDATAAQIAYFRAIPWCATLLSSPPGHARLIIAQPVTRRLRTTPEHALICRMLNTPGAIPAYILFYTAPPTPDSIICELSALVALGPMLNGWAGVCHGGVVAMLLDDMMGQVVVLNNERGLLGVDGGPMVTSRLETRFLKPVRTGMAQSANVVLVTGRLVKVEGRKYLLEAEVRGEDGEVLARGESVFVALRWKL